MSPLESLQCHRSPSLPPLAAAAHPSEDMRSGSGYVRRRFSVAEQQAFGRAMHSRRSSIDDVAAARQRHSLQDPATSRRQSCKRAASQPCFPVPTSSSGSPDISRPQSRSWSSGNELKQLRAVLELELPTASRDWERHRNHSVPSRQASKASQNSTHSLDYCQSNSYRRESKPLRFSSAALKRFRASLLKNHRSLHDAFAAQQSLASWDVSLRPKELRTALSRLLGGEADELFASSGSHWHGAGMSLATFFNKLVCVSSDSLLWELRCRLSQAGLWHHGGLRCEDLVERVQLLRSHRAGTDLGGCRLQANRLDNADWASLCKDVGLTPCEAKQLQRILQCCDCSVALDDLDRLLRAVIGPDTSIMQLAASLIRVHGSFREAFRAAIPIGATTLHLQELSRLVCEAGMSERLAPKLWAALRSNPALQSQTDFLLEQEFVDSMTPWAPDMLQWEPNSVLLALEVEISKQFKSLPELRSAIRHTGLPGGLELSSQMLCEAFEEIGVAHCDLDVVIAKARRTCGISGSDPVTFDDVIEALRSSWSGKAASNSNILDKGGMRMWQQLTLGGPLSRAEVCKPTKSVTTSSSSTSIGDGDDTSGTSGTSTPRSSSTWRTYHNHPHDSAPAHGLSSEQQASSRQTLAGC